MNTKTSFSTQFLQDIKQTLADEKQRLEDELGKFTKKNPHDATDFDATFPEYGDEEDDNAREVAQYTANKPLELTLEKTLRDVNQALDRLAKGTYGTCKYCERQIEEKRLSARPTSSACVSCKKTLTNEV